MVKQEKKSSFQKFIISLQKIVFSFHLKQQVISFKKKFETIGSFLETAFHADNLSQTSEKGFVIYELATDVYSKRISIRDMQADKGKVQLMKGLYWHFDKDPHMLIEEVQVVVKLLPFFL